MANNSQEELEKAAKVYQVNAVEAKVDQVLKTLNTIVEQTKGLVTITQLDEARKELKASIKEEIEKIHLEYGPMKRNLGWFIKVSIVEGLLILGQIVIICMTMKK